MPTTVIPITTALEQSFVAYLSSSVTNITSSMYQASASFYTGYNNQDRQAPAITVTCTDCREVYHQTQIYECMVDVTIKEMAADTSGSNLSVLAANVYNEIYTQCGYNNPSKWNNTAVNFSAIQIQTLDVMHSFNEDALISTGRFRVIGGLYIT